MPKYQFKVPKQSSDYEQMSDFILNRIESIIGVAVKSGENKIFIRTNLKRGLPLENINKVAGPFIEAWALEKFETIADNLGNQYDLIHVEAGKRLDPFDIILQFKKKNLKEEYVSANIDVKATAEDIKSSGKSPNITSYERIRNEYIDDPDYIFVVLSLKHKVYSEKGDEAGITYGIMEVTSCSVYDLKYVGEKDLNYNPALGTGQLQIRDIHYVEVAKRTTWEFLRMLDKKYIKSRGEASWKKMAKENEWIKD